MGSMRGQFPPFGWNSNHFYFNIEKNGSCFIIEQASSPKLEIGQGGSMALNE